MQKYSKSSKTRSPEWIDAPDIKTRVNLLVDRLEAKNFLKDRLFYYRSKQAKTRAAARIWGLGRIWQLALKTRPAYILEVVSEKFDYLSTSEQDKILLHEIAHIPNNFSGALVPHFRKGKRKFSRLVKALIDQYQLSQ